MAAMRSEIYRELLFKIPAQVRVSKEDKQGLCVPSTSSQACQPVAREWFHGAKHTLASTLARPHPITFDGRDPPATSILTTLDRGNKGHADIHIYSTMGLKRDGEVLQSV